MGSKSFTACQSPKRTTRNSGCYLKGIALKTPELIIGSSLSALCYSYKNKLPLVYQRIAKPHPFERFSEDIDLSVFNMTNDRSVLKKPQGSKLVGIEKIILWNKLFLNLSLNGLIACPGEPTSSRLSGNVFKYFYNTTSAQIDFEKAIIFDGSGVAGIQTVYQKKHQVLDWMNIKSGAKQKKEIDLIESENNFVNEVIFYRSQRSGNTNYKDCLAISYLSEKELREVEYTDTYAMFKVRQMMKAAGLKGQANGFYDQYPDKKRYYDIRIDPTKRQINRMVVSCYPDEENESIYFNSKTFEEILNGERE